MKKIVALLLAVMMVFALCACGGGDSKTDEKTLVVGIDPEYPPYSYIGSDGEYTGFDLDLAQAVVEATERRNREKPATTIVEMTK